MGKFETALLIVVILVRCSFSYYLLLTGLETRSDFKIHFIIIGILIILPYT